MQDKNIQSKQNFLELFEIIKNKFISKHGGNDRLSALAKFLGHSHKGKVTAWSKGQWPNAQDCWGLHIKMGLGLEWLLTGEGDPEGPDASVPVPELGQNDSEMANLRQRVKDLEKIVALQEEMLEKYRKAAEGNQMDKGGVSRPGHGQASGQ